MKKSIFYASFAFLSLVFTLTSCDKYEEGANFSLLPAKVRLVNTWTLTSNIINGSSVMVSGVTTTWDIKKNGSVTVSNTSSLGTISDDGNWEFNEDKTKLVLTNLGLTDGTYDLIMLKNKDLKLRQSEVIFGSDVVTEWTFTGE